MNDRQDQERGGEIMNAGLSSDCHTAAEMQEGSSSTRRPRGRVLLSTAALVLLIPAAAWPQTFDEFFSQYLSEINTIPACVKVLSGTSKPRAWRRCERRTGLTQDALTNFVQLDSVAGLDGQGCVLYDDGTSSCPGDPGYAMAVVEAYLSSFSNPPSPGSGVDCSTLTSQCVANKCSLEEQCNTMNSSLGISVDCSMQGCSYGFELCDYCHNGL